MHRGRGASRPAGPGAGRRGGLAGRPAPGAAAALGLLTLLALLTLAGGPASAASLPPLTDGDRVGAAWHVATLPQQGSKPVTRFAAEVLDGLPALRVDADRSYGNLVFDLPAGPLPARLRWSWRLQRPNPAADLYRRSGDDVAAKVCVSFDLPLDRVPFTERQILRLVRASSGQALPAATVCYVWAGSEPRGALIANAYTRRVRYIVLRNASDGAGVWADESRDLAADFLRAFADESAQVPPLTAVVVGGDADNTGLHTVGHVSGLRFEP